MKLTVLLDLDDTLLGTNIDRFLPGYLQALGKHLDMLPADRVAQQVLSATRKMLAKKQPAQTLEQLFDSAFYPALGLSKEQLRESIEHFYAQVFPGLKAVTQPLDGATQLVEYLFEQGCTVAIATNPLFPRAATFHRLAWAGLPVSRYPFSLVSTYESFHFAKPNLAYYAEVLGQLGWPEQPAVMIGDDLAMDILPAGQLGLPTFWVNGPAGQLPPGSHPASSVGSLTEVIPWIKQVASREIEVNFDHPPALEATLSSTPAVLDTLARNLPEIHWNRRPHPGEWSFTEILYHLRDVDAEVNWPRIEKVCNQENPFLAGVVTDPWADEREYNQRDGAEGLDSFLKIRTRILALLQNLDPEGWRRPARHAIFGPTSMQELITFIAIHDRVHVRQAREASNTLQK